MRTRTILGLALGTFTLAATAYGGGSQQKPPSVRTPVSASKRPSKPPPSKPPVPAKRAQLHELFDRMHMLDMGNRGDKAAHLFLEDAARGYSGGTAESRAMSIRWPHRKFKAPRNDGSIVVMFRDNSGVYIHPDGFVTPMGDDISQEVEKWEEMK